MLSWFKKKDKPVLVKDIVFATAVSKLNALSELARQQASTIFVAWFEDSREQLQQHFDALNITSTILMYREMHHTVHGTGILVFIEHHPLAEKERNTFDSLAEKNIIVYSSLDEPLFTYFGGERISALLSTMGLDENEAISHPMITKSIRNIQEKLAGQVSLEQSAHSMEEWMKKNVGLKGHH